MKHSLDDHPEMGTDQEQLVASIEDNPIARSLDSRTTFIPLRHHDLVLDLIERYQIRGQHGVLFTAMCARLQRIFHAEHLTQLLQLEEIYGPLDPDSQAVELTNRDGKIRNELTEKLFDRVSGLLFSAHYVRLERKDLERAVEVASQWGVRLEVNFDLYARLEIFARGYHVVEVQRRRWRNFFRAETIELPEFERLIMAFRLKPESVAPKPGEPLDATDKPNRRKVLTERISRLLAGNDADAMDADHVYLKTFKNIPETDLEMLLPGSKVRLSMLDRGKILLPTAMALYKISRTAAVFLAVLAVASYDNVLAVLLVLGAIGGYVIKSVLSYFRTKQKYQFGLTKSLYLKNLGNNSGVLYRILNEAEEQELLEAILGYAILWQTQRQSESTGQPFKGMTSDEMDAEVEAYLADLTSVDIDFEIFDSLGKLARLGLANVDSSGRWTAIPIDQAEKCLDDSWSRLFQVRGMRVEFDSSKGDGLFTS
ncbi:DUF3754 domain-containing protein [Mariniblastus fucicola]|uniref:DUF3754 domain-containing protein n=2 Tax=Mariniblastus fucicola TaxID=980251 RepID=A0A5B9P8Q4_9BACT|nr:DUF3754 domain-containing protein [Mariniblastus fucicola]QEG23117.1 hypothetical protein MFFC18_30120 [Mariniblastus fucicola]